jgi:hypothetical protein
LSSIKTSSIDILVAVCPVPGVTTHAMFTGPVMPGGIMIIFSCIEVFVITVSGINTVVKLLGPIPVVESFTE